MVFSGMKLRWLIAALIAAAVLGIVGVRAFYKRQEPVSAKTAAQQPPQIEEISLPASIKAAVVVAVPVPIEGKIELFQVEVGDEVYEGQMLAHIRSESLDAFRERAEADYIKAEDRVHSLESAVSSARLEASRASADASRVRNDYERASRAYQRQKMLLAEGATPRLTFEKAEKEFQALEAESKNLDSVATVAEERISNTQRDLDAARKLLENKTEDLDTAKERIGSGDVLSPVTGIVIGRRGQAGDDVHPSMTDLFQIASDLSVMDAVADVSPAQLDRLKAGQPATVLIAEMGGEILQGKVAKIEDGKVIVEFPSPNPMIKPGLTAQIRINLK
jgi:multidrug resistance efflux pump